MLKTMRFWLFWPAAALVIAWYMLTDPDGGADTLARLQWMLWLLVVTGPVYLVRRALINSARAGDAYRAALNHPIGAGLVFLGLCVLSAGLFLAFASRANANPLPAQASQHLPTLRAEITAHWPTAPGAVLAGQVEQETCLSLTHRFCWNPRAELKTSREYGFGLGQLTITQRFDNFAGARQLDPSLRSWTFAERYDPARQLRALVLMDRAAWRALASVPHPDERLAMTLAAYNGGLGGLQSDRRLCAMRAGCDPTRWWGHVEQHSLKARRAGGEYAQSFFAINRGYVRQILTQRAPRYRAWFDAAA